MPSLPSHKVSFLIDPVQQVWKEHILDNYFFEFEAETIKRIPFCQSIQEDVLIWPWNLDSECSVKSGYQFLLQASQAQQPSNSMVYNMKPLWNKIWGLNVSKGKKLCLACLLTPYLQRLI